MWAPPALLLLLVAACSTKSQPTLEYMPDMSYGPRVAAQHEDPTRPGESVMREPVPGTVPRGFAPYRYDTADSLLAQAELVNPLPRSADVLARGQPQPQTRAITHPLLADPTNTQDVIRVFASLTATQFRTWLHAELPPPSPIDELAFARAAQQAQINIVTDPTHAHACNNKHNPYSNSSSVIKMCASWSTTILTRNFKRSLTITLHDAALRRRGCETGVVATIEA
jgi:hypothetical protein